MYVSLSPAFSLMRSVISSRVKYASGIFSELGMVDFLVGVSSGEGFSKLRSRNF
jgi:hypothetical protein